MATTKIEDIIVPEVFTPYVISKIEEQSAIFKSGMAVKNEQLNRLITGGGKTMNIPAFKDLTGRSELLDDTTALTPGKIATQKEVAVALYRGRAWSSNDLAAALAGADPYEAIASLVADYWTREQQAILLDTLEGVFKADSMTGLVAGGSTSYYSGDLLIDAQGKLGDAAGKLKGFIMHSAVRNDLLKKDKTAFETWRENGVEYNKYLGYDVIVDDTCQTSAGEYTSYLFAQGAVSLGGGQPVGMTLTETDRDILAGNSVLVNRQAMVIHPNGVKFIGSPAGATPSDTELKTGTNWERVADVKQFGIVKVSAKLGAGA